MWFTGFWLAVIILNNSRLKDVFDAFLNRAQNSDSLSDRISDSFMGGFSYLKDVGIFGFGVGAAQNGAAALINLLSLPKGAQLPPYETETARIMLELGIFGFLIWYGLRIIIIIALFKTYRMLKSPLFSSLALTAFLIHLFTLTSQVVTIPSFLPHFWFLASFIFLLPYYQNMDDEIKNNK